jgi:membrane protein insertase Oxa1/YidC/SpoIIIJ
MDGESSVRGGDRISRIKDAPIPGPVSTVSSEAAEGAMMGTVSHWLQVAVSWVLVQLVEFYAQFFGVSSGHTWNLAFVTMALLVTVVFAYPTRRQLEMQRLTWELNPVTMKIARAYKHEGAKGRKLRRDVYQHFHYSTWWQLGPTFLSLAVFLSLNSVVEGLSADSARGVFTWPQYGGYVDAAQKATFLGVPYPIGLQSVSSSNTPWLAALVILGLLALMIPVNAALQRQLNGPLATNKWMRRQQRISLYAQPVVLLVLVVILNVAVGVMVFQLACDLFSLGIQTYWLRRRPLPPVDTEWLDKIVAELPTHRP